jgi:large subunit ribosomal protein L25
MAQAKEAQAIELEAQVRDNIGKADSRRQRRLQDLVPAVIYGSAKDPVHILLVARVIKKFFEQPGARSKVIDLNVAGKVESVVVKAKQLHPAKGSIMHIDFMRVNKNQALTMNVPLHFENADTAPGVKAGGIVAYIMTEVEISCKPADLPAAINVDLAALELDHVIHLSELILPQGVVFAHEVDADHDQSVVSITEPRAVAEVEETTEEATETAESKDSE